MIAARIRYALTTALTALTALTARASAQGVGHPPDQSPYRDLRHSFNVIPAAGYLDGDGGNLGIGPHDGWLYGLRAQIRSTKFISIGLLAMTGSVQRRLLDPHGFPDDFDLGLIDQNLTLLEGQLQFNLTGNKTWRRLAPYGGIGIGAAIAGKTPQDTSGYNFGTKLMVSPFAGLRIMPVPRIGLMAEVRAPFWKLSYPATLRDPDDDTAVSITASEWAVGGFYLFGLVIAF